MNVATSTGVIELHELQSILQERSHRKAVQRAVEVVAHLVPSCSVMLLRISPQGKLRIEAWANIAASIIHSTERSFDREGLPRKLADIVHTKKPVIIEDFRSMADWREPVPSTTSWAGFPILLRGRVIAIVNVQAIEQRIGPEVVTVIEPVVSTIALLILRYEEARELAVRNQQMSILYEMAVAGAQATDEQGLQVKIDHVLERIGRILGYAHVVVFVHDPRREMLVLKASRGREIGHAGMEMDVHGRKGVTVRAFLSSKPVLVRDTRMCAEFIEGLWPALSELAIPLLVGGSCVGVLNLESPMVAAFTHSDIRLLTPFASGLALLIDNQQKTKQLREQATRDGLTGFFNRRMMDEMVPAEIQRAARYHRDMSLAMLDLDGFKAVNDNLGHEEGDRLLRVFAGCIRKIARASDLVFRYGGDEFLLLLPETTREQAEVLLKRLTDFLCPELITMLGRVTFSTGIANYVSDSSAEDLVKLADDRLYESKRLGKGHITSH
ncbi:GGDEF domain-containing protein [Candidatus Cryosericum hinesii]|uniref:diguanylate cyclase n=1 Tax=Candidatus Cryosericum hinesii TaxID=2290915 RepID=A0A398DL37_9BACT|nr:sensor domain-containing diguanylate cyclase [Candidatus Cryosericum hinesii]RIE10668.1 GGDEF domain-containing protein [Candidatus Cryosericum hinesii]RIE12817.1 GGDEF domain-containing protein [Candidatus Cryosericum hinesii]RIE12871.1 GGDEF domain-containing protein [Candidatus Cryosericum hinesii]